VSHHLTHHLFPGVPWYNLPKLTRLLHDDAAFRADAFVSSSYLGRDGVVRKELRLD
jgi:fatty acid desaturase